MVLVFDRAVMAAATVLTTFAIASWAAAAEPWIIAGPEEITSPIDLGDVIVVGGGSLSIRDVPEPGVRIEGNLWVVGDGVVELQGSTIEFLSRYNGQYSLVGIDDARLTVDGCDYRVPPGVQHGLVVAGTARLDVMDTTFGDVQLVASEGSTLVGRRLDGNFEVIPMGSAHLELEDIPATPGEGSIWVWVEMIEDSVVDWSPPMPGFVDEWSWPPATAIGVPQSVEVRRCEVRLWPMLVRPGSDLVLRDIPEENWVVVGLHMPNSAVMAGLFNDTHVADTELALPDRRLRLINTRVDTWNLYPEDRAVVELRDSVIGEILTFDDSQMHVVRSEIDGTGGFLGHRPVHAFRVVGRGATARRSYLGRDPAGGRRRRCDRGGLRRAP